MPHIPFGKPPYGSTAWAAERIARILEREEQEAEERRRRALRRESRQELNAEARQRRPQPMADLETKGNRGTQFEGDFLGRVSEGALDSNLLAAYKALLAEQEARRSSQVKHGQDRAGT